MYCTYTTTVCIRMYIHTYVYTVLISIYNTFFIEWRKLLQSAQNELQHSPPVHTTVNKGTYVCSVVVVKLSYAIICYVKYLNVCT